MKMTTVRLIIVRPESKPKGPTCFVEGLLQKHLTPRTGPVTLYDEPGATDRETLDVDPVRERMLTQDLRASLLTTIVGSRMLDPVDLVAKFLQAELIYPFDPLGKTQSKATSHDHGLAQSRFPDAAHSNGVQDATLSSRLVSNLRKIYSFRL